MYRRRSRGFLGGMSGGIFMIGLAIAFFSGHFLPVLFVTLAVTSLLGSVSSMRPNALYGGLHSFVWLLGLAFCFIFGFWPWILVVVGASAILGAMRVPIMAAIVGAGIMGANQQPTSMYQPYQPQPQYQEQPPYQPQSQYREQPSYQPYQQGYQAPAQAIQPQGTYQEGNQQHPYQGQEPVQPLDEQPQTEYPQQHMPPQQQ